ncbi:sialidase family protein [Acerihabitans arboris]|uniref:Exo-alpha-sialidase n=1 Tax=Acerihabitans arboris TaxID=2691583 RepID=A0A845SLE9_9GAMM|nr:sialidase family protein [Acerihabitans arboris]NDL63398.1 exo-alpha-sialidase [Acerihabitans arboris]
MANTGNDGHVIYRSGNPTQLWCYTPAILKTSSGRLVVTLDLGGPGLDNQQKSINKRTKRRGVGKIFISDDLGQSWVERGSFPFWHARPFECRGCLYIIGNAGDLYIIRSRDDGMTWTAPAPLTRNELWHGSATNILQENGAIYMCMDLRTDLAITGWNVAGLTPVILRGDDSGNLLERPAWTFSAGFAFKDKFDYRAASFGENFGIPFYPSEHAGPRSLTPTICASPPGWLEGNLVRITDPKHIWHDPNNATLYIILRANTNGSGYASVLKAIEQEDGGITLHDVKAPSGKVLSYIPFPGGSLKFYILYDAITQLYWMASSIIMDSMCKLSETPTGRYNLPSNQRNILGLYYSSNCVDWMQAHIISKGETEYHARNYPAFVFSGQDILLVARSGDGFAKDGQYANLVTFHTIRNFRSLVI